ncbi:MAG TPA: molybdopterin-guanine dinucleotide biosynthesis protein B, partial [Steroidobacteraceae bacterium]|nr:molybdopterin-guanine dinucleotide biosynthesis protein B [Steroidobacteraceae bacterium]
MGTPPRVVAIVGRQGSGKTTLIERLIPALQRRGLTVSTIKHTHHHQIELDVPGKDSYRHRMAGASEVIVASDSGWAR